MNKYQKAVASAVTTGVLLFNGLLPVLASSIIVTGNGSDSDNNVYVDVDKTTAVTQTNSASVTNTVTATSSTGGNDADDNTGGDVSIETGDAKTDVSVANSVNSNAAEVDCCGSSDFDVEISGNGTDSDNKIDLDINQGESSATQIKQKNVSDVDNIVKAKAKTGYNDAEDNTGGAVSVKTGDATTSVKLGTAANANSAKVGGAGGEGGSVSALITGNGSHSDNDIYLDLADWTYLTQSNSASVLNDVKAKSSTGGNEADDNTGGEVEIETGDAETTVEVDNAVNFNWADADCGCLLEDLMAKIAGNGTDSDNMIDADLGSGLNVGQTNGGKGLENLLTAKAKTGYNDAEDNTGDPGDDPSIETGDAETKVKVENTANSNGYGADSGWELPVSGLNLNISFNLGDLLDWLGL